MCFKFEIHSGTEEVYERAHNEIWPEFAEAILEVGYRNYSLFRRGTEIICYCECIPDIATAQTKMKENYSHLVERWNKEMEPLITKMTDNEGNLFTYDLIWHLNVDAEKL